MDTHLAAPLRFAIRVSTACLLTASAPFFAGCVNVARTGPSEAMQLEARPVGFPESVRAMGVAPLTVGSDLKGAPPWIREAAIREPVNVLALSGGGAGGAFGAGALVGWTRAGTRPEFQVVTGVSVGAARELIRDVLIAAASIPGAFPPVMIHVERGNDGDGGRYSQ
jgi:hypothetical protein